MAKTPPDWYLEMWQTVDATWGNGAEAVLRSLLEAERTLDDWREKEGFGRGGSFPWSELPRLIGETDQVLLAPRLWGWIALLRDALSSPPSEVTPQGRLLVAGEAPISPRLPGFVEIQRVPREDFSGAAETLRSVADSIASVTASLPLEQIEAAVQGALEKASLRAGHATQPRSKTEGIEKAAEGLGVEPESLHRQLNRLGSRLRHAGVAVPGKGGRPRKH